MGGKNQFTLLWKDLRRLVHLKIKKDDQSYQERVCSNFKRYARQMAKMMCECDLHQNNHQKKFSNCFQKDIKEIIFKRGINNLFYRVLNYKMLFTIFLNLKLLLRYSQSFALLGNFKSHDPFQDYFKNYH